MTLQDAIARDLRLMRAPPHELTGRDWWPLAGLCVAVAGSALGWIAIALVIGALT